MAAKAKLTHAARADDEIARDIRQRLKLDNDVPDEQISVEVNNGLATLEGDVEKALQKEVAETDARKVKGVRDVVNRISVKAATLGAAGE